MNVARPSIRLRTLERLLPSDRLLWGTLAAIAAVLPPWERMVSVDITGMSQAVIVATAILLLRAGYVVFRPSARKVHALLENGAAIITYTAVLATVSYLCARNSMPLRDGAFEAADRMMGYDWQAWADFEYGLPAVGLVLRLAYASLLPQIVLVLILLPIIGDGSRGFSLLRASLIAAIIACVGSYALPAAGPSAFQTDWYPHWAALRTAAPFTISLANVQGIISFPSFHASLAVLLLYAVRGLGVVTWGLGSVELLMLISTPTFGHHYCCDVLAGIAVAVIAIGLTKQLDRRFPVSPAIEPGYQTARTGAFDLIHPARRESLGPS